MDLEFDNLLYSSQSLEKPYGIVEISHKNSYPGEEGLRKEIKDFDSCYVIRYNSHGNFAYGGIPEENKEKTIIAVTKNGDRYRYKMLKYQDIKDPAKSWSLKETDFLEKEKGFENIGTLNKVIRDKILSEIKKG